VDTSWIPEKLVRDGLIETASVFGIFSGGDAISQPRTIATAIAAAKKAAISMDLFFRGMHDRETLSKIKAGNKGSISMEGYLQSRENGIMGEAGEVVSPEQINTLYFEKSKRGKVRKLGLEQRRRAFLEVNLGIDAKKAAQSASRCYSCGTCNACYACSYFCPEGVISIDPDTRARTIDTEHCKGCGICARSCPRHAVFMKDLS
jgi:Pyruvate/2-oxoacid:ferredoxin oxidoreductase delta subunit